MEKGDIDIAWQMFPDQIKALGQNKDIRIESYPATTIGYIGMNVTKGPLGTRHVDPHTKALPFCRLFQPMFEHAVRSNIESFYAAPTFVLWKLYPITNK